MPRANDEVAEAFNELADLLEISGAERFKVLAYRRAATTIESLSKDIKKMSPQELGRLRGIGKATGAKIKEFLETGTMSKLEEARGLVPSGIREMTRIPGLGPKKVLLIYRELGITTLEELKTAVHGEQIRELPGMGAKTEQAIAKALRSKLVGDVRVSLDGALSLAEEMLEELRRSPAVQVASYAGSLRRMRETIGDIDLLAAGSPPAEIMEAFVNLPQVDHVIAAGSTKTSIVTKDGMQVDLRVVAPDEWGAALQYFTGSKEHNVRVREIAVKSGLKLSEYGVFKVPGNERVAAQTEEEVYAALGMDTPPPTMREDRGEVQLALKRQLPALVTIEDIRGDLHSHSTYSDGAVTVREMAYAALERGYEYFAITDHARNIHVRALSIEDIERQRAEIATLNEELAGKMTLLHGVELNIDRDGSLDYPDDVLARFDVVIASIHQHQNMPHDAMTRRILKAIRNPQVNIFGHPTARRIGSRPPIEFDLEKVFKAAADSQVALEINSNPMRLDLKDDHVRLAREFGCVFSIDSDSHMPTRLSRLRLGVYTAQRGWATADSVINTRPLEELRRFLTK